MMNNAQEPKLFRTIFLTILSVMDEPKKNLACGITGRTAKRPLGSLPATENDPRPFLESRESKWSGV
jgi:hypothetical protein